jgi:hypothetical protein
VLAALKQEINDGRSSLSKLRIQLQSEQGMLREAERKLRDINRHLGMNGGMEYGILPTGYTCNRCYRKWISNDDFQTCCEVAPTKVDLDEVDRDYW